MSSNNIRPMRVLLPQRGTCKNSDVNVTSEVDTNKAQGEDSYLSQGVKDYVSQTKKIDSISTEVQEDASITPSSDLGTIMSTPEENHLPYGFHDQSRSAADCMNNNSASLLLCHSEHVHQKKVSFASGDNARAQGNNQLPFTVSVILISRVLVTKIPKNEPNTTSSGVLS